MKRVIAWTELDGLSNDEIKEILEDLFNEEGDDDE